MRDPHSSRPRSTPGPASPASTWEYALFSALHAAQDRADFARVLAAAAVHPDGLGAGVAHVLRRDPLTEVFERIVRFQAPDPPADLAAWLALAHGHDTEACAPGPAAAPLAWDFEALDAVTRDAWRDGRPAWGAATGLSLPWAAGSSHAVIPLRVGSIEHGVVVAEFRDVPVPRERLARIGEIARTALDLRDRLEQLERRTGQAGALLELSTAALSPRNLAEVLHLASRLAADRAGAEAAAIWGIGADAVPVLHVTHGPSGARERHGRALSPVVQAAIESARPRFASPATDEMLLPAAVAAEIVALAIWPIEAYGRPVGALGVWTVHGAARRLSLGRAEREFLGTAANLVGFALDQSRRFAELRAAEHRERDATRYARRRESRSEERRVGKECSSPCRSRWSPYH